MVFPLREIEFLNVYLYPKLNLNAHIIDELANSLCKISLKARYRCVCYGQLTLIFFTLPLSCALLSRGHSTNAMGAYLPYTTIKNDA